LKLKSNSSLAANKKCVVEWLTSNKVLKGSLKRFLRYTGVKIEFNEISAAVIPSMFFNGVLLCEIVRRFEQQIGTNKLPVVEFNLRMESGSIHKQLVLQGCIMQPKTHAACMKNVTLSLSVLKSRPEMGRRHLYSPEKIVQGDEQVIWELLEDTMNGYSPQQQIQVDKSKLVSSKKKKIPAAVASHVGVVRNGLLSCSYLESGCNDVVSRTSTTTTAPKGLLSCTRVSDKLSKFKSSWSNLDQNIILDLCPETDLEGTKAAIDEETLGEWLVQHGISIKHADKSLLEDPYRNGLLFVNLFQRLEPSVTTLLQMHCVVHWRPQSVIECLDNVRNAFTALCHALVGSGKAFKSLLSSYAKRLVLVLRDESIVENIVKGNEEKFWELISCVYCVFLDAASPIQLASTKTERLDHMYQQTRLDVRPGPVNRNSGFVKSKTTSSSSMATTRLGVENVLPYSEQELQQLDSSLIEWLDRIGVLRQFVSTSPSSLFSNSVVREALCDGTLLADAAGVLQNDRKVLGINRSPKTPSNCLKNIEYVVETLLSIDCMGRRFLRSDVATKIHNGDKKCILGLLEDMHRAYENILPRPSFSFGGKETPYLGHKPHLDMKQNSNLGTSIVNKVDIFPGAVDSISRDILPMHTEPIRLEHLTTNFDDHLNSSYISNISEFSSHSKQSLGETTTPRAFTRVDTILHWLATKHRIFIRDPAVLRDPYGVAPEFNDGVLLCRLVVSVEHIRMGIRGVDEKPKVVAACLHNIVSALKILRKRRNMSPKYLFKEREIHAGKVRYIVPLLDDMMKAYK